MNSLTRARGLHPFASYPIVWKQAKDTWFEATNGTLARAWTSISNDLWPFQALSDARVAAYLDEDEVFRDGEDAPHAGLFDRHFDEPPFPAKKKN